MQNLLTQAKDVKLVVMDVDGVLSLMNERKISQLLILNDDNTLAGILTLHDLLQAGVN